MINLEIEQAIIDAFVDRSQHQRVISLIKRKKGRSKFIDMLAHTLKLNNKNSIIIPANKQNIDSIVKLLQKRGAPEKCYIISENYKLDGTHQQLIFAAEEIIGSGNASIISCIPGVLGFYEGEDKNERYLLNINTT